MTRSAKFLGRWMRCGSRWKCRRPLRRRRSRRPRRNRKKNTGGRAASGTFCAKFACGLQYLLESAEAEEGGKARGAHAEQVVEGKILRLARVDGNPVGGFGGFAFEGFGVPSLGVQHAEVGEDPEAGNGAHREHG